MPKEYPDGSPAITDPAESPTVAPVLIPSDATTAADSGAPAIVVVGRQTKYQIQEAERRAELALQLEKMRNDFFDESPLFDGLRHPEAKTSILNALQFIPTSEANQILFDPTNPENSLGGATGILIPIQEISIQIKTVDGAKIFPEGTVPEMTAMGGNGFRGKPRMAQITSKYAGAKFWRINGTLENLELSEKDQLLFRANLLAAHGNEMMLINDVIKAKRVDLQGIQELPEAMDQLLQKLGLTLSAEYRGEIQERPGYMFYLAEGTLKVNSADDDDKLLGLIHGPQLVHELVGVGRPGTAKLKTHGVIRGCYVPVKALLDSPKLDLPLAGNILDLAESSFGLKMNAGNDAAQGNQQVRFDLREILKRLGLS